MFCVYKNGSVESVFHGEFKDDTGTYPAAHLRAIGVDGRAELDVYLFTDQSKSGYDNNFYVMGEIADAAPDENGEVIRTSTPVERNVDVVKAVIKDKITQMRSSVAHDGVVYMDKNFVTDRQTVDSINLIAIELADDAEVPWDTMDTIKAPTEVFVMTGVQFRGLRDAIAVHYLAATVATRGHVDAVDALSSFSDLVSYDYTTSWPTNPDRSEPD
jgi:hypothetical protein